MKPHIHTITELAIFTAIAFIFSYIESLFPLPIPFPGIKLGLTHNIGQFAVAAWLVGPSAILPYFPFLYFSGLIAGGLIGAFVLLCRQRIPLFSSTN